ncbi:Oligoribonuclease, mitochondrial, variant 2 [Balamuthia mandrillaris]
MERKEEAAASLLRDGMVWMDLEMTGLNVKTDRIMEVACIVTDAQLNVVAEAPEVVIHLADEELEGMNDWCKEHHGASGLTQACRESRVTLQEAEEMMLSFVQKYTAYHTAVLAGNSIHMDKVFLAEYMPRLLDHLHYRIVVKPLPIRAVSFLSFFPT